MFTESKVELFMGGEFTLEKHPYTSAALAEEFRKWAAELDGWGDAEISEVAIVKDKVHVTLKEGIAQ